MSQCLGSRMVLDAPEGTEKLTCPNCNRLVPVWQVAVWEPLYDGNQPQFRLRGHQR